MNKTEHASSRHKKPRVRMGPAYLPASITDRWEFHPERVIVHLYADLLAGESVVDFVDRHHRGDWGVIPPDEWARNVVASVDGTEVVSVFMLDEDNGLHIWTSDGHNTTFVEAITREQLTFDPEAIATGV